MEGGFLKREWGGGMWKAKKRGRKSAERTRKKIYLGPNNEDGEEEREKVQPGRRRNRQRGERGLKNVGAHRPIQPWDMREREEE